MQIMNRDEMTTLLALEPLGRLGMVDGDRPYVVPMPFFFWRGNIYLPFRLGGRKHQVFAANAHACFEVDWSSMELDDYASILLEGTLEEIGDAGEYQTAMTGLVEKYNHPDSTLNPQPPPLALGSDATVLRLTVDTMRGLKAQTESLEWVPLALGV